MDATASREPPFALEIEQNLLGALIYDNRLIDIAAAEIEAEAFFDPLHQRMFDMILALHSEGEVTPLVLYTVMKRDPAFKEIEGLSYLTGLAAAAPSHAPVKEFAGILRENASRRALIEIGEELVNAAYETPARAPISIAAASAVDEILNIGEARAGGAVTLASAMLESVQRAEKHLSSVQKISFVSTGLKKLDEAMGGMQPGDRIAIAGRTGAGKSLFTSALCMGAALTGAPVLLASADMRRGQWANRAACDVDNRLHPTLPPIYYSKFRKGTLKSHEIERLMLATMEVERAPIFIDDNPKIVLATLRGRLRAMARRYPGKQGIVAVDFLQKVEPPQSKGYRDKRRDEDLTQISYDLGDMVKDIGWTLLALVQMKNKGTDSKGNVSEEAPNVTDIRESGGIEMAFDIIVSPFRKAFAIEQNHKKTWPERLAELGDVDLNSGMKVRNHMRLLGFKNRDDSASDLNLDLWCEPGAAVVRDEAPYIPTQAERDAAQLAF